MKVCAECWRVKKKGIGGKISRIPQEVGKCPLCGEEYKILFKIGV